MKNQKTKEIICNTVFAMLLLLLGYVLGQTYGERILMMFLMWLSNG